MADQIQQKYHGQQIIFDEKREEWGVMYDFKWQYHKSLQIIKNYIDRRNKKEFTRVPIFAHKGGSFYNHEEGYDNAEITSVGVDGTVFIVREGSKSAEHCGTAYVKNDKNAALIKEIAMAYKAKKDAENKYDVARRKLKEVDLEALRKKALGETKE